MKSKKTDKMNLIYITNVRLPTHKAHGLQIIKSCEAFARNGLETQLIVPKLRTEIKEDPFGYYSVDRIFKMNKTFVVESQPLDRWMGRWASYVQGFSFSLGALVHTFFKGLLKGSIVYSRDYITLLVFSLAGLHPVAEIHDYRFKKPKWSLGYILRRAKKIVVNSEGTFSLLKKHYNIDTKKVLIASNGVDINFFNIEKTKEEARRDLGLSSSKKIIGYIGSLKTVNFEKGIKGLIEAFGSVKHSDLELLIVGGPNDIVAEYKITAPKSVRFCGHVDYNKIPLYLRAVDFVTIPLPLNQHARTTSPIKLFESMAAGKPIITSNLPSLKEYLGNNAIFFEPDSVESLKEKIEYAIDNFDAMKILGENVLADSKKYSWDVRTRKIIGFIKDI